MIHFCVLVCGHMRTRRTINQPGWRCACRPIRGNSNLIACGGVVESSQDNFPGEIDRVPEFRIVETERGHILPELLNMSSMRSERLKVGIGRRTQVR